VGLPATGTYDEPRKRPPSWSGDGSGWDGELWKILENPMKILENPMKIP